MPGTLPGGVGEVYPGYGDGVGPGRGYTGTHQDPPRTPLLDIFQSSGPTYGQMKVNLRLFMRFLRYGSRIDPELTQN